MQYQEAVDWIHGQYGIGNKNGLENERSLLQELNNPQRAYPCVHIAGTNGKGSTCAMIASALRAAGLRVGLYTSPYLMRYNERMRVDGQEIPDEELAEIATDVRAISERLRERGIGATVFELGTACAFEFFKRRSVDIAVIEVGLGGRLDPTNVLEPAICGITHIGLDHVKILGDTLEKIAAEKAGIIKDGIPCVLYPQGDDVANVVREICRLRGSSFIDAGDSELVNTQSTMVGHSFTYRRNGREIKDLQISLPGRHQLDNARTALCLLEELRSLGIDLSEDSIRRGLQDARWPGRLEWCGDWLLDGAHNAQGAQALAGYLLEFGKDGRRITLCGIQSTKDVRGIVEALAPAVDMALCVPVDSPHPTPSSELAACFEEYGVKAEAYDTLIEAADRANALQRRGDMRVICGSLYLAGAARTLWLEGRLS